MADLANSLTQEEIPVKLRCASCNKLVLNAFRLPCCDQSVCETCQSSLPETCPVCAHSPLTAEDCKPNKALRLTVKAFLKNEEKKRDKGRSDEVTAKPASPILHAPTLLAPVEEVPSGIQDATVEETQGTVSQSLNQVLTLADAPTNSVSETNHAQFFEGGSKDGAIVLAPETDQPEQGSVQPSRETESVTQQDIVNVQQTGGEISVLAKDRNQHQTYNPGFGYDGMNNGLANWQNAGAYNPMMGMQTGMPAGGWGFTDMMGISSMGVNPMMMSQGMFGGFNGQGMGMASMSGMAGMNMGMGYHAGYGGWGAMGLMGGDFGANAGYYPGSGYNQQSHQENFHQLHHQPYAHNNYSQNRSRGHAYSQRGYGRDHGYHDRQAALASEDSEEAFRQQLPTSFQGRGTSQRGQIQVQQYMQEKQETDSRNDPIKKLEPSPADDQEAEVRDGALNVSNRDVEDETKTNLELDTSTQIANQRPDDSVQQSIEVAPEERDLEHSRQPKSTDLQSIAAIDTAHIPSTDTEVSTTTAMPPPLGPAVPLGPAAQFFQSPLHEFYGRGRGMRGHGRTAFGHRGRGFPYMNGTFGHAQDIPVAAPLEAMGQGVMGAPTGPKAMREGQPNGGIRGRGGFQIAGRGGKAPPTGPARTVTTRASPSYERQTTRSRSGSRSRSPTLSHRQNQRKRSASDAGDNQEIEYDQTRERKYSRSSRYDDAAAVDDQDSRPARRSSIEASSRHRSHRDKDKHRSSRHDRSREHRKHRDRSRSPVADNDRDFGSVVKSNDAEPTNTESNRRRSKRDSSRHRDRERLYQDKDRKHFRHEEDYHRSLRSSKKPEQKTEPREFKIKDRSKQKDVGREEKPNDDAHTVEREARNTERLLKEMQRRASMGGGAGAGAILANADKRKRSRTNVGGEVSSGSGANGELERRSSRRKLKHGGDEDGRRGRNGSHKYESEETAETRALRIETEREAARWG